MPISSPPCIEEQAASTLEFAPTYVEAPEWEDDKTVDMDPSEVSAIMIESSVRWNLIEKIKDRIDRNTYTIEDKVETIIERLLDDLKRL